MSTYMSNLESGNKGKNTGGEGFDPVLWIELRHSSMVRVLDFLGNNTSSSDVNNRLETDNDLPTMEEINESIKQLKNNKAPGGDGIQAELLKHTTDELRHNLCKLIQIIWEEEIIPMKWKMGFICPLHKEGDQLVCSNYRVQSFVYLGSLVNSNNDISEEISRRIQSANRCYYGLQKQVKSRLLSRGTKRRLYKTLIKPVLTYASETWALSERDKFRLAAFERKILRRIFGPVRDGETWRIRYNNELYQLYESPDIITSIKIARLRWAGHVKRMGECEIPRKVMEYGIAAGRRVGRPKLRWMDCVMDDIKRLGVKNWWTVAKDRDRKEKNS
ncbi:hypothetical protein ANN_08469 [Periplaneta americana]|uniref:Endonuclease-reverse transcriptase n=1 Tax=Periplaneta americana TaxID=6978 RepID=A0ABQ8T330_PERAM|nr:hypothetical protein ANN_08469 [Periplaneta americana]